MKRGKPHPEGYLRARRRLRLPAERAVAVENGVLRLEAEAAVWASEVRFQERRILSRLTEACGAEHVREIRCTLRTGAWKE